MSAADDVTKKWDWIENEAREQRGVEVADLIAKAAMRPELRQLFPFFSLNRLCFSRVTKYPYSKECPYVNVRKEEHDGHFAAFSPMNVLIVRGDVDTVLKAVVENLPQDCGPAHGDH